MYSILKHSQVSYNYEEPYYVVQKKLNNSVHHEITSAADDHELKIKNEQTERDVKLKCDQMIQNAQKEAEEIIKNAQLEAGRLSKQKEKEGFEQGMQLAYKKCNEEIEKCQQFKDELQKKFEDKILELKKNILNLSFILAKKVVKLECSKSDHTILSMLDSIVNKFRDEKNLTIEVSENNYNKLISKTEDYKLKSNGEFSDTDVQVSLDSGVIDASLDVQFENLQNAMIKESLYSGV